MFNYNLLFPSYEQQWNNGRRYSSSENTTQVKIIGTMTRWQIVILIMALVISMMTLVILKMTVCHSFKILERYVVLTMKGDAILKLLHQRGLNLHHISALIPGVNKMSLNKNLFTREGYRQVPRRETWTFRQYSHYFSRSHFLLYCDETPCG